MEDSHRAENWREEGQRKLKRLHSLLFGAELSLEKGEPQTSLGLSLRLLGFLDSECKTEQDRAFIAPIQKQVRQKLCAARDKLVQSGDFHVSQQGRPEEAWIFKRTEALDLETIKQSKYYKPFFDATSQLARRLAQTSATDSQKPMEIPAYQTSLLGNKALGSNGSKEAYDGGTFKGSRGLMQAKITSLYGNGSSKSPDSLGKSQSFPARNSYAPPDHHQTRTGPFRGNKYSHYYTQTNDEERDDDSWANRKRRRYEEMSQAPAKARSASDEDDILEKEDSKASGFVTAKQKLALDSAQKWGASASAGPSAAPSSVGTTNQSGVGYGNLRNPGLKTLGMNRRGVRGNFIPPVRANSANGPFASTPSQRGLGASENGLEDSTRKCLELLTGPDGELPEKLRNLEPRLLEHVSNEIMDQDPNVRWSDIGGLEHAKKCVTEMVIWPLIRPDIFKGCRSPGKGLLLFGPPGTGKTMIGKAIAGEAKATFFYISSSSLTSKWIGEGEKLVRALFGVASCRQPAVIFIDEIDSLLSQRKADGEHESSRRLKTQFLIEMEGFASGEEQLLFIGATNRPQELDEAARRRLSKRLYIPLPSAGARAWIVKNLLKKDGLLTLSDDDIDTICKNSEGYSGSDMSNLVKEASMGPLREVLMQGMDISNLKKDEMRPVMLKDFLKALQNVKPSVSSNELGAYEDWNRQFGSHSF